MKLNKKLILGSSIFFVFILLLNVNIVFAEDTFCDTISCGNQDYITTWYDTENGPIFKSYENIIYYPENDTLLESSYSTKSQYLQDGTFEKSSNTSVEVYSDSTLYNIEEEYNDESFSNIYEVAYPDGTSKSEFTKRYLDGKYEMEDSIHNQNSILTNKEYYYVNDEMYKRDKFILDNLNTENQNSTFYTETYSNGDLDNIAVYKGSYKRASDLPNDTFYSNDRIYYVDFDKKESLLSNDLPEINQDPDKTFFWDRSYEINKYLENK